MAFYITPEDLRLRLTARILVQMFDDDRDNVADVDVMARFIDDGESYFEGGVQATYGEAEVLALRAAALTPGKLSHSVIRLCVDAVEYMTFARHPDYIRGKWEERRQLLDNQLKQLKLTELRLPPNEDGDPAPVAHARGEGFVESSNGDECPDQVFNSPGGGMGIFSPGGGHGHHGFYYHGH